MTDATNPWACSSREREGEYPSMGGMAANGRLWYKSPASSNPPRSRGAQLVRLGYGPRMSSLPSGARSAGHRPKTEREVNSVISGAYPSRNWPLR